MIEADSIAELDQAMIALQSFAREITEDGGVVFDLHSVSYYPKNINGDERTSTYLYQAIRRENAYRAGVYEDRPLGHTPVQGDITVHRLSHPPMYIGTLSIQRVTDEINPRLTTAVVSPEAFDRNSHTIKEIKPKGYFGHIYTTDNGMSNWSLHIQKVIPEPKP